MKNFPSHSKGGFTLVEIMVSISIFLVVMTASAGAILAIFDANHRTEADRAIMDNLNLAVETMSREMRFGTNYHCGSAGTLTEPADCGLPGASEVAFKNSDNEEIVYRQNGSQIERSTDGGSTFLAVTAPEVTIEDLSFYVLGSAKGDGLQPKAIIKIAGYSEEGTKANTKSEFTVETLVSERALDI